MLTCYSHRKDSNTNLLNKSEHKNREPVHGGEEGGIFGLFRSLWGSADDKPVS
jgi:hypothetical protein